MKFTVTKSITAQQKLSRRLIESGKTIAVVPTMGFLHEGHLSLIRKGLKKADIVVTTIYVNPTQFAPGEDLDRYPRDTAGDIEKIRRAGGHVVFLPQSRDMYPAGYQTYVEVETLTASLEGASRPTHFRGVTTIVAKLFNIVRPDIALFGMKDYQQAMVLKRMTRDLNWPIRIIIGPTVRESDGLALSSRNSYLTPELRREATALYLALKTARNLVKAGERKCVVIRRHMVKTIRAHAPSATIEYIAFTDMESLDEVTTVSSSTISSLAVRLGKVRLIDNMKLG